ncbi:unnamed protein product [Ectocarpus sp. 12 AP-2014]
MRACSAGSWGSCSALKHPRAAAWSGWPMMKHIVTRRQSLLLSRENCNVAVRSVLVGVPQAQRTYSSSGQARTPLLYPRDTNVFVQPHCLVGLCDSGDCFLLFFLASMCCPAFHWFPGKRWTYVSKSSCSSRCWTTSPGHSVCGNASS